jgi:hypothetical protein
MNGLRFAKVAESNTSQHTGVYFRLATARMLLQLSESAARILRMIAAIQAAGSLLLSSRLSTRATIGGSPFLFPKTNQSNHHELLERVM